MNQFFSIRYSQSGAKFGNVSEVVKVDLAEIRLKPVYGGVCESNGVMRLVEEYAMVNSVKCSRQIQEDEEGRAETRLIAFKMVLKMGGDYLFQYFREKGKIGAYNLQRLQDQ
ncbi:hypothetical protein AOLI_G00249950 [Acnodon oligacanthus]